MFIVFIDSCHFCGCFMLPPWWINVIVQGSGIGPCLFIDYIMDLKHISSFNTILKYADDNTLLVTQNSSITLQAEFSRIRQLNWHARRMGVAELRDACSDWSTVGLQFGQMSPTKVTDVYCVGDMSSGTARCFLVSLTYGGDFYRLVWTGDYRT